MPGRTSRCRLQAGPKRCWTCASMLYEAGRNVKQVSKWLGHADPAFMLRTYVHLMDDGVGDASFFDSGVLAEGGKRAATSYPETVENPLRPEPSETSCQKGNWRPPASSESPVRTIICVSQVRILLPAFTKALLMRGFLLSGIFRGPLKSGVCQQECQQEVSEARDRRLLHFRLDRRLGGLCPFSREGELELVLLVLLRLAGSLQPEGLTLRLAGTE